MMFSNRIRCCEVERHHLEEKQEDFTIYKSSLIFWYFNNRKKSSETRDLKLILQDYVVCIKYKIKPLWCYFISKNSLDQGRTSHRYIKTKFWTIKLWQRREFSLASRFESVIEKLVFVTRVNSFDFNLQSNHSTFQHYRSLVSKPIFASLT